MPAVDTAPASVEVPPVLLTGFLNSPLGLGQVARALARAFEHEGIPFESFDQPLKHLQRIGSVQPIEPKHGRDFSLCICSINGEHFPAFAGKVGNKFFQNRYVIGVWFWETTNLPEATRKGLPYVDELWTCSEFTAQAIRDAAPDKRVRIFPYPLDIPHSPPSTHHAKNAKLPAVPPEAFQFCFSFDYNSCVRRKNPAAVCDAFRLAFPAPLPGGPVCIIKSINGEKWPVERQDLESRHADRPDIIFYDGFLHDDALHALMRRIDCYVSLHRAEGLGLTILEAMVRGKPCIATAYSGNLTFMTRENSWLIPAVLEPVGIGSRLYPPDDLWASPDIQKAADAMLECFKGGPTAARKAENGRLDTEAVYALPMAAKTIRGLLAEASANTPATKVLPPALSAYVGAREQLGKLRSMESAVAEMKPWSLSPGLRKSFDMLSRLSKENRKACELILKASREREAILIGRLESLEAEIADTRRHLAEILRKLGAKP